MRGRARFAAAWPGNRRRAYTLLEMVLALAIALIILGAVYEFLNRQISMAEMGRELVEEGALARALLDRMGADLMSHLGALDPQQLPGVASDPTQALLESESFVPLFNTGLEGTSSTLILCTSRVPRELLASDKRRQDSASLPRVSDLRRISYWVIDDGEVTGLAREELIQVTSDDLANKPPNVDDPYSHLIASEVKGVMFEYFDGLSWVSSWNGAAYGPDAQTPLGPPAAVRITLTLRSADGQRTRDYRHTVALPAGNNFMSQQLGF